ncbi:ankyrin repeat-containing domain protein [Xylariomycetidae sp. FL2044]|nr:ankyrin repeat-containing domain protein [Xylariomycetidae sp. FL2044]
MGPLQLPVELLLLVAGYLPDQALSRFCLANRAIWAPLNPVLYRRNRDDHELFRDLVEDGSVESVRKFLEAGADPNSATIVHPPFTRIMPDPGLSDYMLQLFLLDQQNHARMWRRDTQFKMWTPLHMAALRGDDDMITLLLDYGANIHTAQLLIARGASFQTATRPLGSVDKYMTALHDSCSRGRVNVSRFIVDHYQLSIEVENHEGLSPIALASASHRWDMVEWLVKNGANINAAGDSSGRSLLLKQCLEYSEDAVLQLISLGADVRCFDPSNGATPLHRVCNLCYWDSPHHLATLNDPSATTESQKLRLAKRMIEVGAEVNAVDNNGYTPLMLAAKYHMSGMVGLLLHYGADIGATNEKGRDALMIACFEECLPPLHPVIDTLLSHGASATAVDNNGESALEVLCHHKHIVTTEDIALLLAHGAPVNPGCDPKRSLIAAIFRPENLEACELLVQRGARAPDLPTLRKMVNTAIKNDDAAALRFALQFPESKKALLTPKRLLQVLKTNKTNVAKIILDAGANWKLTDNEGRTCLILACAAPGIFFDIASKLLSQGADPNQYSNRGLTPLHFAITTWHMPLLKLLVEHGADVHFQAPITEEGDPGDTSYKHPSFANSAFVDAIRHTFNEALVFMVEKGLLATATREQCSRHLMELREKGTQRFSSFIGEELLRAGADPGAAWWTLH